MFTVKKSTYFYSGALKEYERVMRLESAQAQGIDVSQMDEEDLVP